MSYPCLSPALVILVAAFSSPALGSDLVLRGRIERVVAAGDLVAAVRGEEVRVFFEDGRPLLRLGSARDREDGGPDARATERRQEELFDQYGVPENERDSPEAERLFEDESTLRDRRAARRASAPPDELSGPPLLAASATDLWLVVARALWRVEPGGQARRVSTLLPRFDHLAAAGDRLIAAAGARLWLSADGGATFVTLDEADGPVRAVAAGATGMAWASQAQLWWRDDGSPAPRVLPLPAPPRDLRYCESTLLVLTDEGLASIAPDATVTALARGVEAHRLGCGGSGAMVLAGPGLLASSDGGRTFSERFDRPAAGIGDVAVGERCLWIATTVGLYCVPPRPPASGPPLVMIAPPEPPRLILRARDRGRWAAILPQVAIAATATTQLGRHQVSAVALAEFGLGPPAGHKPAVWLAQAPILAEPPAEPAPMSRAIVALGPDREASCLPVTRAAAVSLMLAEPERARSYVARAANAAWLPELRLRVERRLGRSESLDVLPAGGGASPGPLGLDTANDVRYEARATWDLSKLVFSTEELAAETQALRMADTRREVESLANRLYFERRRLKMELVLSPSPDAARARRELRVQELEAELDMLSGGAFTRCLPVRP